MLHAMSYVDLVERLPHTRWFRYASPAMFYGLAGRLLPWCWAAVALFGVAGSVVGLLLAPTDAQQGDAYRIVFVHVPAAWMSMVIYVVMAFWAGVGLVFRTRLSAMMATALAPTGALMAFIALSTGALWAKPTWGVWWVWDARLAGELALLMLYLGIMALQAALSDPHRRDRAGALLALAGALVVPLLVFSVQWWNTQHQDTGVSLMRAPNLSGLTVAGMLLMVAAFWAWAIAVALHRARSIILEREGDGDGIERPGAAA